MGRGVNNPPPPGWRPRGDAGGKGAGAANGRPSKPVGRRGGEANPAPEAEGE